MNRFFRVGGIVLFVATAGARAGETPPVTQGELRVAGPDGVVRPLPLKHTDVRAEITGHVARVLVTQTFQNPYDRKIEAVYVFPLPDRAAVDDMQIALEGFTIKGAIKRKEEAHAVYQAARRAGQVAALLDQERPNIFTQAVANILPGSDVVITIRYFETLPYESGIYTFSFPMVVGPRFVPASEGPDPDDVADPAAAPAPPDDAPPAPPDPSAGDAPIALLDPPPGDAPDVKESETGRAPATTETPDASHITPPVLEPGLRSGHDIALEVRIDGGGPLAELTSPSHQNEVERIGPTSALVRIKPEDSIPNKDFVLRYRIDGKEPSLVVLPHRVEGDGRFLLLLQPEAEPPRVRVMPKEMIFVVDCSGSMSGFPIEKVKEAMRYALSGLDSPDTFQIIRFSDRAETFAREPVPATPANVENGLRYVEGLSGNGGTIMIGGVRKALGYEEDPQRLRIVSFMTDGYIGNEDEILKYLSDHLGGARLFSFGVGSSPNRYLLDKMAEFGRGAVEYMLLTESSQAPVQRFYDRIRSPYLTDISIDWGDLKVMDLYPRQITDLFLGQPIVLYGRYARPGAGEVTLRARLGGVPYERRFHVELPERREEGEAIATLWARARIEDLSAEQIRNPSPDRIEEITELALANRLVSAYTSFVAVAEWTNTGPEEPETTAVPVCMPEGASYEGVFRVPGIEMKETVSVSAKGEVVNTETTTTSTTFSSEFIDALPILGRDYQDVLTLAPGVSDADGDGNPTIHGSRDTDVITLVDGVTTNDPLTGKRGQEINIESIDEIEVKTAGAGVDYGRGQGGFVTLVTKSGGNEFEGRFSMYWRGNTFDGDGAGIDDPKLHGGLGELGLRDLSFNDFYPFLSLGGPIKKDKAWYYFTAEYIQIQEPVNATTQAFVRTTKENRVFGKASWDMSTNHKLQFTANWDPQTYYNLGIDSLTAVESGYQLNAGGLNLTLKETAVFNPNVFLETTLQHFQLHPESIPTLAPDTNHNGVLFIDRNNNKFWDATEGDPGEDYDRDGRFDVFEDTNHNRVPDFPGEDRDGDGHLTTTYAGCEGVNREDVDCDGHLDFFWEDADGNHTLDAGEDRDADRKLDYIDEDLNHNHVLDNGEDRNGNGKLDTYDPNDPFWKNNPLPYIEDRNLDQIMNDRPRPLPDDVIQQFVLDPDGNRVLVGLSPADYPYGEFNPVPRDRTMEQDQKTLRISGPNAGQVLGERGSTDFVADLGRNALREDLTVFVPDWHGQHDLKFGGIFEHESYDQTTLLRPILFPNAAPPTAATFEPRIGVQLPAENTVFNTATASNFGMYAMDTYKPLPNLTLGMGVRFDRESTDSFGYTPFDPVAERDLYDRLNALGGFEHQPEKELGNADGILSRGYCADPLFFDRPQTGNACDHPLVPNGQDPNYDSIAMIDQDLGNLKRVAPSRLTQHHTGTTIAAANLASLFPDAVKTDPVTGTQYIDRDVLRESGAATFQEQEAFRLTNNNIAPRVSVSWDPWADSKTKVFANWGRYYDRLFLDTVVPEEGPDVIFRYYVPDINGVTSSGTPNNGIGNPIAKAPPSATQVDRGLQTPFSDELTIGFERELAPEISLKITYINKQYRDQLQDRDINHSLRYRDDDPTVPLDINGRLLTSGGAGGGTQSTRIGDNLPDLYIHNFFFNNIYRLANINHSHYSGVEFQVTKRVSRKWQMDASYTYSRNTGFADSFYSALGDDPATVGQTYGYQTDDQRHVIKFSAITYLPKDWQVGGTTTWSSGLPYSVVSGFFSLDNYDYPQFRFLYGYVPDQVDSNGQRNFAMTRRNDQRNDAILNINLHADKAFVIGKLNSRLFLDIQNVLNQDHLRIYAYEPSAPDRGGALQVISERDFGRRFQIGFQFEF